MWENSENGYKWLMVWMDDWMLTYFQGVSNELCHCIQYGGMFLRHWA